jgi:hypothetical protein
MAGIFILYTNFVQANYSIGSKNILMRHFCPAFHQRGQICPALFFFLVDVIHSLALFWGGLAWTPFIKPPVMGYFPVVSVCCFASTQGSGGRRA